MSTAWSPADVCRALDIEAGELADIFRREARREFEALADEAVTDIKPTAISTGRVSHMLVLADVFEDEYARLREVRGGANATQSDGTKGGSHSSDEQNTAAQGQA